MSLPKIFKFVETQGLKFYTFDEDLHSIKYKYKIIPKIISIYVKKYLFIATNDLDSLYNGLKSQS